MSNILPSVNPERPQSLSNLRQRMVSFSESPQVMNNTTISYHKPPTGKISKVIRKGLRHSTSLSMIEDPTMQSKIQSLLESPKKTFVVCLI